MDDISGKALLWGELLGGLLLAMIGIIVLTVLNWGRLARKPEDAPIIFRPPVDPLARHFVYFMACAPALLGSFFAALYGLDRVVGGAGIALLMSGLAVVVASGDLVLLRRQQLLRKVWAVAVLAPALAAFVSTLILPWFGGAEEPTSLPASDIARFFGESFERRTNHPLQAVTGDSQLAALVALGATRPASAARCNAGANALADTGAILRTRRRRGLARRRYRGHTAGRDRAKVSRIDA